MKESNKQLQNRVLELEKKASAENTKSSSKAVPSGEIRVCFYDYYRIACIIMCTLSFSCCSQDAVRTVYKSLCETKENFGFHIE